ncbi:MAG: twin-arginine translocase subunit TatC [Candidatus Paceibacterota bacterium]|jgi:sec-independent protein translocase protein TatC
MTILGELKIFLSNILYWIYSFVGFSCFFFVFGFKKLVIFGNNHYFPWPTENPISVMVFNRVRSDLLPAGVQLIVTNPMSAFVSQILFSFVLGFLFTAPIFIYQLIKYLQPALLPKERKVVLWSVVPFSGLFFSGCLFSYFFLIPATFDVLYPYATKIGAAPFFSIDEFIYYIFGLMISVGVMFLLPLFMALLSLLRIIQADFWWRNWRYAFLFFLILSAIITPDGTGVTMILLFLPLAALYFSGYLLSRKLDQLI